MVITLSGTLGSGMKEIAARAGEMSGFKICDDETFSKIAIDAGYDSEAAAAKYYDVDAEDFSVKNIEKISSAQKKNRIAFRSIAHDIVPMDIQMEDAMKKVHSQLADEGGYIIIGRCANYYLRGRRDCVSVFIQGEFEDRLARVKDYFGVDDAEALKLIRRNDKRRSDFYAYFTSEKWSDCDNYDFHMNSSRLGMDGSAGLLCDLIKIAEKGE